jgi:hypothetical protein
MRACKLQVCLARTLKEYGMDTITAEEGTQIYLKDWGSGQNTVNEHLLTFLEA